MFLYGLSVWRPVTVVCEVSSSVILVYGLSVSVSSVMFVYGLCSDRCTSSVCVVGAMMRAERGKTYTMYGYLISVPSMICSTVINDHIRSIYI